MLKSNSNYATQQICFVCLIIRTEHNTTEQNRTEQNDFVHFHHKLNHIILN